MARALVAFLLIAGLPFLTATTLQAQDLGLMAYGIRAGASLDDDLTQLLVNADEYCYLRTSPEEYVLVVLNRGGAAKPIEIDVDDLGFADGMKFQPDLTVANRKLIIREPKDVQIYWSMRAR